MTSDTSKSKTQLIAELNDMRRQVAALRKQCRFTGRQATAFESIGHSLPDLNFIYDLDGRYIDVVDNQHQLVVYPEMGDLIGSRVQNVLPRNVADMLLDTIRRSADANEIVTVEYQLEVPAGLRWFEGRLSPIVEQGSKPERVLLVARDITKRKEIELARERRIKDLQHRLRESRRHPEVVPICSFCHRIRDGQKNWQELAVYLHQHFQMKLSHGVCPACLPKHYPDYTD